MGRMGNRMRAFILMLAAVGVINGAAGCNAGMQEQKGDSAPETTSIATEPAATQKVTNYGVEETDFSIGEDNVVLTNREPVPKEKKFAGAVLTVAAPSGRMADFLHKDGQEWAKRMGVRLEILELSFAQIFEQEAIDLLSDKGSYDVILYPHYLSGDIMGTGKLVPLETFMDMDKINNSYQNGGLEWDSYFSHYKEIYCWYNGHIYSMPMDGDVFQVAYRKDLWIRYAEEFKAKYHYALRPDDPTFPETWDQYYDIAEFFNGKDGLYGTVDINARSRASTWHFLTRYVSYLQKDGMYNGDVYFDKETMKPLINNPAGVKAMEDVIRSSSATYSPAGVIGFGWDDMQQAWHQGKTAIQFTWPAMLNIARRPGAEIPGGVASTGYSLIPGSTEVYDADKGEWVDLDVPHRASPLAHGWQFSIVETCAYQAAAFDLIRWMTTGDRLIHHTQKLYWEYEPVKEWQIEDPAIKQQFKDAPSYLESLKLNQQVGVPDLRIPGAVQMYDAIEIYKIKALEGKMSAQEAVDAIATDWSKIVKQRGLERMKKAYIDTITPHKLDSLKNRPAGQ